MGARFPSWATTKAFVEACGGEEFEWRERWNAAAGRSPEAAFAAPPPPPLAPAPEPASSAASPHRRLVPSLTGAGGMFLLVLTVTATVTLLHRHTARSDTPTSENVSSSAGAPHPGDSSRFIADLTVPDGSTVTVGQRFVKVWQIQNTGTVAWHDRYLQRADLPADNRLCVTPERVPVPDTPPGAMILVSVSVTAPKAPGSCWVGWKMVDGRGQYLFPGSRPLYLTVNVTD